MEILQPTNQIAKISILAAKSKQPRDRRRYTNHHNCSVNLKNPSQFKDRQGSHLEDRETLPCSASKPKGKLHRPSYKAEKEVNNQHNSKPNIELVEEKITRAKSVQLEE